MFSSVLIANRGEIACRIIRTARAMGLKTIAVFSEADRRALHVRQADVALPVGPAAASESYLVADNILAAARDAGADCIHPGYGFLSENAEFAEACAANGIAFIGPSADAIRAMGLKDQAKALMQDAGVPVVPGFHGKRQEPEFLRRKAYEIGYPVLIKAVAGGGGKGMRLVHKAIEFEGALESAAREAQSAFGNSHVLIEKFITNPRHVEIQVFADGHGNAVHLFERDCSLQRRHQKVIEEAPAPGITEETRQAMGAAAVAAAKAVDYQGAGTVEFIADGSDGLRPDGFWFMEMNTRLQVEHPVTEAVTGLDLVEWQFRVAAGEALPLTQDEIRLDGHAVEARLYAEDPEAGFLPSTGRLWRLALPEGDGIRVDSGVEEGDEVSAHYDPMIAKIIAHGADRTQALGRLGAALGDAKVAGPKTNARFLRALVEHPEFGAGEFNTGFIDRHLETLTASQDADSWAVVQGARHLIERSLAASADAGDDPWALQDGFHNGPPRSFGLPVKVDGEEIEATVSWPGGVLTVRMGEDRTAALRDEAVILVDAGDAVLALVGGRQVEVSLADPLLRQADGEGGHGVVQAPMTGKVIAVHVAPGDTVSRGMPLFVVEAMKMEHAVASPIDGVVAEVMAEPGQQVSERARLVVIEDVEAD